MNWFCPMHRTTSGFYKNNCVNTWYTCKICVMCIKIDRYKTRDWYRLGVNFSAFVLPVFAINNCGGIGVLSTLAGTIFTILV